MGIEYFVPDGEPTLSRSAAAAYLQAYTDVGDWVVDPFCQSASLVLEALESGRPTVAVNANPLDILRVRMDLVPVPERELTAAVTRLADSLKSETTLRQHLLRLYRTQCPICAGEAVADYFIWERGGDAPLQASYRCPSCGASGMRHCDQGDADIAHQVPARGLHYWHLVDRAAKDYPEGRALVEELLDLYTPRNLYALSNLILKVADLFSDGIVLDALRWVLLNCLEQGSKLETVPGEPESPPSPRLQPAGRFAEWNVWQLLERLSYELVQRQVPFAALVSTLDGLASSPGMEAHAFVGHMSVRTLTQTLGEQTVRLVVGQPPVPGRQQWSLPYLWTGCLFGHRESALLWPLVEKRTSFWWWYSRAVHATLEMFRRILRPDGHIVLSGLRKDSAFHEALALAAAGADLKTDGAFLRAQGLSVATKPYSSAMGDYQLILSPSSAVRHWTTGVDQVQQRLTEVAVEAAERALRDRGEPAPFVRLHCGIWQALAQRGILQRVMNLSDLPTGPLEWVRERIRIALQGQVGAALVQLWADEKRERCLWWLRNPDGAAQPLAERVEQAVCRVLGSADRLSTTDVVHRVYQQFPGQLTPDAAWADACLQSYGIQDDGGRWALNSSDHPSQQSVDRAALIQVLVKLGTRLGLNVQQEIDGADVRWMGAEGAQWAFMLLQSVTLSRLTGVTRFEPGAHRYGVVADARQELLRMRLASSPVVCDALVQLGWQLMVQSTVEQWLQQPEVTLGDIEYLVIQDLLDAYSRPHLPTLQP